MLPLLMLHLTEAEGIIVISQPAHAWLSGQLARHWREEEFSGAIEEVCLAAEQHDIGFLNWEQSPTLNAQTGLPHTFMDMPCRMHLEIWDSSIRQMLRFGRYPALLVSRHFTTLAQRKDREHSTEEQRLTSEFLQEQEALQSSLETSLINDFYYAPFSTGEIILRHQQFVSLWDWMSLLLCHGLTETKIISHVPFKGGAGSLKLKSLHKNAESKIVVEPWPFTTNRVNLVCEGRRLLKTFRDEEEMRVALKAAAPVMLPIVLAPA